MDSGGNWLNAVANKQDYIEALRQSIRTLHNCWSHHLYTSHVKETFHDQTVWEGDVEVFAITGHPKAKKAYAWAHLDGDKDDKTRFVTVLEVPPVNSPETAVRASIMDDPEPSQPQP